MDRLQIAAAHGSRTTEAQKVRNAARAAFTSASSTTAGIGQARGTGVHHEQHASPGIFAEPPASPGVVARELDQERVRAEERDSRQGGDRFGIQRFTPQHPTPHAEHRGGFPAHATDPDRRARSGAVLEPGIRRNALGPAHLPPFGRG